MAYLGLNGPWNLDAESIDAVVRKQFAGNYALGHLSDKGGFVVSYVGRSDHDLNGRLHEHIGKYPLFKASYAILQKVAFVTECQNYHDFKPPGNGVHPSRPEGTDWRCPVCEAVASPSILPPGTAAWYGTVPTPGSQTRPAASP